MNKEAPESNNEKNTSKKWASTSVYPRDAELPEGMERCSSPYCNLIYRKGEGEPICQRCR